MQVRQIMESDVATCPPDANLATVAKLMWDHDCGFVPVVGPGGMIVGVLTDRDICIASATRGLAPEQIRAEQAMRQPIHVCQLDDTLENALATMKHFQVRRLPVIAADGTMKGVLSMNDVVLAAQGKGAPKATDIVTAMAMICAHRPARVAAA